MTISKLQLEAIAQRAKVLFDGCERYASQADEVSTMAKFALNDQQRASFKAQAGFVLAMGELSILLIKRINATGGSTHDMANAFIRAIAGGLSSFCEDMPREVREEFLVRLAEAVTEASEFVHEHKARR